MKSQNKPNNHHSVSILLSLLFFTICLWPKITLASWAGTMNTYDDNLTVEAHPAGGQYGFVQQFKNEQAGNPLRVYLKAVAGATHSSRILIANKTMGKSLILIGTCNDMSIGCWIDITTSTKNEYWNIGDNIIVKAYINDTYGSQYVYARAKSGTSTYSNVSGWDKAYYSTPNVLASEDINGYVSGDLLVRIYIEPSITTPFFITSPKSQSVYKTGDIVTVTGQCYNASSTVAINADFYKPSIGFVNCTNSLFFVTTTIRDKWNTYRVYDSNYVNTSSVNYYRDITLYGDSTGSSLFAPFYLKVTDPQSCKNQYGDYTVKYITGTTKFALQYNFGPVDPFTQNYYSLVVKKYDESGTLLQQTTSTLFNLDSNLDGTFAYDFGISTSTIYRYQLNLIDSIGRITQDLKFNITASESGGCQSTLYNELVGSSNGDNWSCDTLDWWIAPLCKMVYISKDDVARMMNNTKGRVTEAMGVTMLGQSIGFVGDNLTQFKENTSSSYVLTMTIPRQDGQSVSTTMNVLDTSLGKQFADGLRPYEVYSMYIFFMIYIFFRFWKIFV